MESPEGIVRRYIHSGIYLHWFLLANGGVTIKEWLACVA